ncbi:Uncharacterised protein [Paenibacillus thiaminolyticus]|nr:Uncharacterised protein [Paenibacillus thiaminolyticus]
MLAGRGVPDPQKYIFPMNEQKPYLARIGAHKLVYACNE